jgi:hypothetical protein
MLAVLPFKAEATPCDFELTPQIIATQTIYNYTMNASNASVVDNVSSELMSFNLNQFLKSGSQYIAKVSINDSNNLTISQTLATLSFDCNNTKTFFIINSSDVNIVTKPNNTVTFSFIISPRTFSDYVIKSWGIFNISERNINISNPYFYNVSAIVPDLERGTYRQVFEIRNGLEAQYLLYDINNTGIIHSRILKAEVPTKLVYGKYFNLSFVVDNTNLMNIELFKDTSKVSEFNLKQESAYLFDGSNIPFDFVNIIKLNVRNNYTAQEIYYNVITDKTDFTTDNIILPSLLINYTSFIPLVDFKTDAQIPITVTATTNQINVSVNGTNITQSAINADYYFANERGTANPIVAKQLYLYINPKTPERGHLEITIASPAFDNKTFSVDYVGGSFNNQPVMDINYYNKPTHCVIKPSAGYMTNYTCTFDLPSDYDVKNLQNNELDMIKSGCDMTISAKDQKISDGTRNYYMLIGLDIIVLIIGAGYLLKDKMLLRFG